MALDRLYSVFSPLDVVRRWWLAGVGPIARDWIVERDKRVAATLGFAVVSSLVLASTVPIVLLALGPLILGVPHIFADIRYLVAQQGLHKRPAFWLFSGIPILLLALPKAIGPVDFDFTGDARWGWGAVIGAALIARGSWWRKIPVMAFAGGMIALATRYGYPVALSISHLHNVFAIVVIWRFRPGRKKAFELAPFLMYAAAAAFIWLGGYESLMRLTGGGEVKSFELDIDTLSLSYSPDGWGVFARRAVVFFAFAQSVHYAVWLRAVPDEARAQKTPRSFSQSARALVADVSAPVAIVAFLITAAIIGYAVHNVANARECYFKISGFHGYVEFSVFALLFCEGGALLRVPKKKEAPTDEPPEQAPIAA